LITVFTPTYNRAYTLTRLFNSMQIQGCRDFEWVVVDDGSTDDTETLCQSFLSMATFPMRYIRQGNAGKHVAINRGATEAEGEWFFIVDSDDRLPKDSIELNVRYISQIADDPSFAGVSGVRARADGSLLLGPGKSLETMGERTKELFAREYIDATSQDYRDKFRMPGDRAEVIRTELVRETPFPSFPGERFVDEYYLWQSLSDRDLKLRWFNKATYCGDYLADGLTTNMRDVMRRNPLGRSFVDNFTMGSHARLSRKIRSAVNYTRYGRYGGLGLFQLASEARSPLLFLLGLPIALAKPIGGVSNGR
jgi:glycosyltransferase involved in cell wall biosynthesis